MEKAARGEALMPISDELQKAIDALVDAADDVGVAYEDARVSRYDRDQAMKRRVAARAAVVAAIEREVEAANKLRASHSLLLNLLSEGTKPRPRIGWLLEARAAITLALDATAWSQP